MQNGSQRNMICGVIYRDQYKGKGCLKISLRNPNVCDATAERVISSLSFSINESCATRDNLIHYINECSKEVFYIPAIFDLRTQKGITF